MVLHICKSCAGTDRYIHYITLHYISFHFISLHCIAFHCITLHCITFHCVTLHCINARVYIYICICTRTDMIIGYLHMIAMAKNRSHLTSGGAEIRHRRLWGHGPLVLGWGHHPHHAPCAQEAAGAQWCPVAGQVAGLRPALGAFAVEGGAMAKPWVEPGFSVVNWPDVRNPEISLSEELIIGFSPFEKSDQSMSSKLQMLFPECHFSGGGRQPGGSAAAVAAFPQQILCPAHRSVPASLSHQGAMSRILHRDFGGAH